MGIRFFIEMITQLATHETELQRTMKRVIDVDSSDFSTQITPVFILLGCRSFVARQAATLMILIISHTIVPVGIIQGVII